MKLDTNVLRYMTKDDFRVLTAVEMGQKNHEIVPSVLIESIAGLKHGGTFKCLKHLLRNKLVHHDNTKYDGYRLTYLGYDYLAIKALVNRGAIAGVGRQIGVGKESDIFEVMDEEGHVMALKLHRLGRTSFRAVKSKRDYLHKGSHFSWLYLSRLAALKEFAFMTALGEHGLPVPQAIDHNRHAVLMTLLDAYPLVQVRELSNARKVYTQLMKMLSKLAGLGLIHCDFNEFNLLINDREELTLIDFPQMVSVSHPNAQELFERDVECIVCFFSKKLGYVAERDEGLEVIRPNFQEAVAAASGSIDQQLRASGFKLEHQTVLDRFVTSKGREDSEAGSSEDEDADNWSRSEGREGPGGCRSSDVGERSGSRSSGAEHATTCAAATTDLVVAAPGAAVAGSTSSASMGEDSPWAPNGEGGPAAAAAAQSMMKGLSLGQKQQPQVAAVLGVQRRRALRRVAASSRNANKGRNLGRRGAPEGSGGG